MHDHRRDKTNTATSSGSTGVLAALGRACPHGGCNWAKPYG
jgi:hypothetical protein